MRRLQTCLPRVLYLIAISVLLSVTGLAQSGGKPGALTSFPCTSQTGLHCEIYGTGDPILFLHGLGGSLYTWRHMVTPLSGQHQVILIDFRGAGLSPKPKDKHYSILEQRDLIYQFILERDLRNLTLVGNSYGGAVSLLVAIKLCELQRARFSKLILINSGGYPDHLPSHLKILRIPVFGWLAVHLLSPKTQTRKVLRESYYDRCKITQDQIAAYARPIALPGGRHALLQLGKQAIPKDFKSYIDKYPTISVPTLILWGEADRVLRQDVATRLDCAIPDSRLEYIKYAGHIPQEEQPDVTVCRIKAFLLPGVTCPPQLPEPPSDCRR